MENSPLEVLISEEEIDLSGPIKNKNVLIVNDIVDISLTLTKFLKMLKVRDLKSIKLASLLPFFEKRVD